MNCSVQKLLFILLTATFFVAVACEKEEVIDTCTDGIFTPGEEGIDCGGPCPPCEENTMPIAIAEIAGTSTRFANFSLEKFDDWIMRFHNDTIDIVLNIGDGDSLGTRSLKSNFTRGSVHNKNYQLLHEGLTLFTEINHEEQYLSFYVEAKLVLDPNGPNFNPLDTLFIRNGDFFKIPWTNQ